MEIKVKENVAFDYYFIHKNKLKLRKHCFTCLSQPTHSKDF